MCTHTSCTLCIAAPSSRYPRHLHATFEEQAAVASSTSILTTCEDPNCGGTAKEGEQCSKQIGFGVYCETCLYCIEANTCNLTYESGGAFCCPNGYQPNNQLQCILNSACTFGPPSPPRLTLQALHRHLPLQGLHGPQYQPDRGHMDVQMDHGVALATTEGMLMTSPRHPLRGAGLVGRSITRHSKFCSLILTNSRMEANFSPL